MIPIGVGALESISEDFKDYMNNLKMETEEGVRLHCWQQQES